MSFTYDEYYRWICRCILKYGIAFRGNAVLEKHVPFLLFHSKVKNIVSNRIKT